MTRVRTLICGSCGHEWDVNEPATGNTIAARMLGDGAACLSCPDCDVDIAIVDPPVDK